MPRISCLHEELATDLRWKDLFLTNPLRNTSYDSKYWTTWFATFLFFSSYYSMLVPFPLYLSQLGIPSWQIAVILGSSGISSLLIRPISGILSDLRERRQIMILGVLSLAVGTTAVGYTSQPIALLGLRIAQAAGYVVFTTAATARIVDLASSENRASALAVYGIAANVAIALIPSLITSTPGTARLFNAFLISGALAGLSGLAVFAAPPVQNLHFDDKRDWLEFFRGLGSIRMPMISATLFGIGFGTFLQFLPLISKRGLAGVGFAYTIFGVGIILTRLLGRRFLRGTTRGNAMLGANLAMALGLLSFALAYSDYPLFFGACMVAIGSGILHPSLLAIHVERMPSSDRGRATASFYFAFDLGIGLGAWALSPVLAWFGVFGIFLAAAVLNGSGILLRNRLA